MAEEYSIVHIYHSFLILQSANGHLGYFHALAIVNCVAMNTGVHVSFNFGFLGIYAQKWDCWVIWQFYFQLFKESPYCSPWQLYQVAFPPTVREGSLFSAPSPVFIVCKLFLFSFLINSFILLYNTVLVLPYIDMNPPQVYMSSQP